MDRRLVPAEASGEQLDAAATQFLEGLGEYHDGAPRTRPFARFYTAMIAAAPSGGLVSRETLDWAEERAGDAIWHALEDQRQRDQPGVTRSEADNVAAHAIADLLVQSVTAAVIAALGLEIEEDGRGPAE